MSGTAELEESLLAHGEFFDDVLADRPAPVDLGLAISVDDVDLDAEPSAAGASQLRRLRTASTRRRATTVGRSFFQMCRACFRRKLTAAPPTKASKRLSKGKAGNSTDQKGGGDEKEGRAITYIDAKAGKHDRKHSEQLLRARLLKSKRFAAYITDCHAGLHARLTSAEGKQLIRTIAEDEKKPVADVVTSLVKGLQEHAIRHYIKRLQAGKEKRKEDGVGAAAAAPSSSAAAKVEAAAPTESKHGAAGPATTAAAAPTV